MQEGHHDECRRSSYETPERQKSCTRQKRTPRADGRTARPKLGRPARHQACAPGSTRIGTNPEQLFAAGWSACFEGAIGLAAKKRRVVLPKDLAIDAEVDLNLGDEGYSLSGRLNVSMPRIERDVARALVDEAHQTCPYSKATRGNIEVAINLV
jgi:lipoyl-dependent peroxiredoxin